MAQGNDKSKQDQFFEDNPEIYSTPPPQDYSGFDADTEFLRERKQNIFTDKKGMFQGGEKNRFLGRLRDKFEAMIDRRSNPLTKLNDLPGAPTIRPEVLRGDKGFTGPPLTDEEKAYIRSRYKKDTSEELASFTERAREGLESLRETGSLPNPDEGLLGGPAQILAPKPIPQETLIQTGPLSGNQTVTMTNKTMTPHQINVAKMADYAEKNPNATKGEVSRMQRSLNKELYEGQRIEQKAKQAALRELQQSRDVSAREKQIITQNEKKTAHYRKQAEKLGIISISDDQLKDMNWAKLKKYQMAEKDKIEKYIQQGFSRSDAIKLVAGKFSTKDLLKGIEEDYQDDINLQKNALGKLYRGN